MWCDACLSVSLLHWHDDEFSEILCTWPAHVSINSWIHCTSRVVYTRTGRRVQMHKMEENTLVVQWIFRFGQTNVHAVQRWHTPHPCISQKCLASFSLHIFSTYFRHTQNRKSFLSPTPRRSSKHQKLKRKKKTKKKKERKKHAKGSFPWYRSDRSLVGRNWIDENHVACIGHSRWMQMKGDFR